MPDMAMRVSAIGGSELYDVLIGDPFRVWALKRGQLSPLPPTPQMQLGKLFERPLIMGWYAEKTGYHVEWCDQTLRVPGRPYQIVTPDALCPDDGRGVDGKLVFFDRSGEWGDEPHEVPPRVDLQMRWYMAAYAWDLWDVAAVINGEPRIYTVRRDLEAEAEILARAEEFWRRYLAGDEIPPIGTSEDSCRWLKQRYPTHGDSVRRATDDETVLLAEYAQIRDEEKELQHAKNLCENQIKQAIGEDAGVWAPGYRFTYKRCKDSQIPDWEVIARLLMQDWEAERVRQLIEEYSDTRLGVRRVHWTDNGKERT